MPIPPGLAKQLHAAAAGREDGEPLLLNPEGGRWREGEHYQAVRPRREGRRATGRATIYSFKAQPIRGRCSPVCRLVWWRRASTPTIGEIEKSYGNTSLITATP